MWGNRKSTVAYRLFMEVHCQRRGVFFQSKFSFLWLFPWRQCGDMIAGGDRVLVEKLEPLWAGKPEISEVSQFPGKPGNWSQRNCVCWREWRNHRRERTKEDPKFWLSISPCDPLYRRLQNKLIVIPIKKKHLNRHRNTGAAMQEKELVVFIRGGKN